MNAASYSTHEAMPAVFDRVRELSWIVGLVGLALSWLLLFVPSTRSLMFPAYLVGFTFWLGIALGGVSLTMLHHLTGGTWGLLVRRPMEAAGLVIIPLAVLFVPIIFGLKEVYPWARPELAREHAIEIKAGYLNPTAFVARAAVYFMIWSVLVVLLSRWSRLQDTVTDRGPTRRLRILSAAGLGVVFLTGSFASIDWMMSLEPEWYSSIYGAMLITGWGLATFAAMTLVAGLLRHSEPLRPIARAMRFQDLGNLTLAFVMLWAYTSFMQYLIIWSGNLREEIPWYLRRTRGGWQVFVALLILFQFLAPFLLLLMRDVKRSADALLKLSMLILALHLVDTTWLILPAQVRDPLSPSIGVSLPQLVLAIVSTAGIGGICVGSFLTFLNQAPLVPKNDPALNGLSVAHEEEDDDFERAGTMIATETLRG